MAKITCPLALVLAVCCLAALADAKKPLPNIVFFLTDDQDQMLGGSFPILNDSTPMPVALQELSQKGATATNWFIHTPICCPSRSELVTGRYFHNLKEDVSEGKCLSGYGTMPCCMHVDEDLVNNQTFAIPMKKAGYNIGMFGKYLNNCPDSEHVPEGFDAWFANGGGTYYSPEFATKGLAWAGYPDGSYHGNKSVYSTSAIGNVSLAWINKVAKEPQPFLAYIAPKACHEPFLPSPWYADHWDSTWPAHEPRPVSWNCSFESRKDHHYTIATEPLISDKAADFITESYKNRWRTLMSVDDIVREVLATVEQLGQMDNTFFIYTSDHGFQLGQFNLPIDKRNVYEYDIRIHMLVRGPGVKAGSTFDFLGSNVDVGPTFLGLAGIDTPAAMDGKSIVPLIVDPSDATVSDATRGHIARAAATPAEYEAGWRDSMFIEYYFVDNNTKCIPECHNIEDPSNNYIAIRHVSGGFGNTIYAEFQTSKTSNVVFDSPDYYEYYDLDNDPWQMDNLYKSADKGVMTQLHNALHAWFNCKGDTCP